MGDIRSTHTEECDKRFIQRAAGMNYAGIDG